MSNFKSTEQFYANIQPLTEYCIGGISCQIVGNKKLVGAREQYIEKFDRISITRAGFRCRTWKDSLF